MSEKNEIINQELGTETCEPENQSPDLGFDTEKINGVEGEKEIIELPSPIPTDSDAENSELYELISINNYEVSKNPNGADDLYLNGNFIGDQVASMDTSAYFSAIHDAFETGRGIWNSEDQENLYLSIIVRDESGTYDWHSYILSRETLLIEPEIKPEVEGVTTDKIPIEQEEFEHVGVAPALPAEQETVGAKVFTFRDFQVVVESSSINDKLKEGDAIEGSELLEQNTEELPPITEISLEIPQIENSDVGFSVENSIISNELTTKSGVLILESLVVPATSQIEMPVSTNVRPETAVENSTVLNEATESKTASPISIQIESFFEDLDTVFPVAQKLEAVLSEPNIFAVLEVPTEKQEKNEALISPISDANETGQVFIPEIIIEEQSNSEIKTKEDKEIKKAERPGNKVEQKNPDKQKVEQSEKLTVLLETLVSDISVETTAIEISGANKEVSVVSESSAPVEIQKTQAVQAEFTAVAEITPEIVKPTDLPSAPEVPGGFEQLNKISFVENGIGIKTPDFAENIFEVRASTPTEVNTSFTVKENSVQKPVFQESGISIVARRGSMQNPVQEDAVKLQTASSKIKTPPTMAIAA